MEELEKAVLEAIKFHIDILVDTEKLLKQINKSNTKKLANENMENIKQAKEKVIKWNLQNYLKLLKNELK